MLGTLVAMSIVQGGLGFPVLHPNVYVYMVSGKYIGLHTADEDVPDGMVQSLIEKVCNIVIIDCH